MDWLRIAPNGILILGGSRSDAWNASVRTRGTDANCSMVLCRENYRVAAGKRYAPSFMTIC
jgi:hypothetical protein